jgi:hypothetical protein
MTRKVLIALYRDEVAPRFDLATEVLLATVPDGTDEGSGDERSTLVLGQASADGLCDLILARGVGTVICGGIEEEYYHYLRWKRVEVLDSVMGPAELALERFKAGVLKAGEILFERKVDPAVRA